MAAQRMAYEDRHRQGPRRSQGLPRAPGSNRSPGLPRGSRGGGHTDWRRSRPNAQARKAEKIAGIIPEGCPGIFRNIWPSAPFARQIVGAAKFHDPRPRHWGRGPSPTLPLCCARRVFLRKNIALPRYFAQIFRMLLARPGHPLMHPKSPSPAWARSSISRIGRSPSVGADDGLTALPSLTPAPPPFSAMNSTPAASEARLAKRH